LWYVDPTDRETIIGSDDLAREKGLVQYRAKMRLPTTGKDKRWPPSSVLRVQEKMCLDRWKETRRWHLCPGCHYRAEEKSEMEKHLNEQSCLGFFPEVQAAPSADDQAVAHDDDEVDDDGDDADNVDDADDDDDDDDDDGDDDNDDVDDEDDDDDDDEEHDGDDDGDEDYDGAGDA
jgi:hypothetical protein